MVEAGLEEAFGVEIDSIKCQKAEAFLRQTQALFAERCQAAAAFALPPITCAAIEQARSHWYPHVDPDLAQGVHVFPQRLASKTGSSPCNL